MEPSDQIISILEESFGSNPEKIVLYISNILPGLKDLSPDKVSQLATLISLLPPSIHADGFGKWVSRARLTLSLTQEEIAAWISTGRDRISKVESGKSRLSDDKAVEVRKRLIEQLKLRSAL